MGVQPNILPFPKRGTLMTKRNLEKILKDLTEELLPYYDDDEEALDRDVQKAATADFGAVGTMSAIAWCHGQIGLYRMLNMKQEEKDAASA
jgi:hypothetical protein